MKDLRILYLDDNNYLQWGLRDFFMPVQEASALVQWVLKIFFTAIGSDKFNPNVGSVYGNIVGKPFGRNQEQELKAQIVLSITHVEDIIKDAQLSQANVPASEALQSIELLGVFYLPAEMQWIVNIRINTKDGRGFYVKL